MATTRSKPAETEQEPDRPLPSERAGMAAVVPPAKPAKADPQAVEYVILHAERPADNTVCCWVVDGTFTAPGRTRKADVLDSYVGVDDARPGLWKAVRASEFAGGISVAEAVMVPKVHREPLKD